MAAHAKVPRFAGGFIGVDVFFVLSGYLITGLLVQELVTTGKIGFINFYARRLRRLLPGLLAMLSVVCVAAVVVVPASEQSMQAAAAASAAMWLSNFYFAFSNLDYFGPNAANNLFVHTWSLGVEEQFYLVWPPLLLLLVAWRGSHACLSTQRLRVAMFVIAATSLLSCGMLTNISSPLAFYLMPLRAWQFALGAMVQLNFRAVPRDKNASARDQESAIARTASTGAGWSGWLGLGSILAASLLFDENTLYPGMAAVLPSIGAAAVLAEGSSAENTVVARVLSWSPLQRIGRVSYSWYLWHWPVLLLGAELVNIANPIYRAELVALSFVLAVSSYHFIEAPIRRNARLIARPGVLVLASLAVMIVTTVSCNAWFNVVLDWMNQPQQQHQVGASHDLPLIYSMGCDEYFGSADVHICKFGPQDAEHTAVLIGDSIGAQWFPAVAKVFRKPGWRLLVLTKSACPMVDERVFNRMSHREYVECAIWRDNALKQLVALKPDVVIFGSSAAYDLNERQWVEGTRRVLTAVTNTSGHIFILRTTPGLPFDGPHCLSAKNWLPALALHQNACNAPAFSQQNADVYLWLEHVARGFRNVTTLDMNDRVCPVGRCDAERGNAVVFRDEQHLTASFVKSLADELARRMNASN